METTPLTLSSDLTSLRATVLAISADVKASKGFADRSRAMALEVCAKAALAQAERIARGGSLAARAEIALPAAIARYEAAAALPLSHWLAPAPKF